MKKDLTAWIINAGNGTHHLEEYPVGTYFGPVDLGWEMHEKYGGLNFGIGLLSGSIFSGSNRLIVTGHSPAWEGFYVSTMGGAGLAMEQMGIDMITLTGRAEAPSLLYLNRHADGTLQFELMPIDLEAVWSTPNTEGEAGIYALMDHVLDLVGDRYGRDPRILAVGPSAQMTDFGAIGSAPVKHGRRTPVDTWAGRGGLGSQMLREHGIAAIVYGGEVERERFRDRHKADEWFIERYGMGFKAKDKASTKKYSFDPDLGTGGTLGANYTTIGGALLSFNYSSIYATEAERTDLVRTHILNHYLKQFNEEIADKKAHQNCGEPCAVMCKKMHNQYKKDYEPYQTMGPLIGVFDQRAAEAVNHHADAQGFDAIGIGGVLSWLMESLDQGELAPEDLGVTERPRFDVDSFDPVEDSWHNARLAIALIDAMIAPEGPLDLREGARVLARRLAEEHHPKIAERFVYVANGEKGWMVPNQYWTPGVLAPMPVVGKYYVYYGQDFMPPRELGEHNADRFRKELILDNIGMCRFHRAWAEEMVPELIDHLYGLKEAYLETLSRLASTVQTRNQTRPWESERTRDLVHMFLRRKQETGADDLPALRQWLDAFDTDKEKAARDFWNEMYAGMAETLAG